MGLLYECFVSKFLSRDISVTQNFRILCLKTFILWVYIIAVIASQTFYLTIKRQMKQTKRNIFKAIKRSRVGGKNRVVLGRETEKTPYLLHLGSG